MTGREYLSFLSAPLDVTWDVTRRCQLACPQCYSNASPSGLDDELTTKDAKRLIDKLGKAGVFAVHFLGGEPLTRGDFFDLLARCRRRNITTSFGTNGWSLRRKTARRLRKVGVSSVNVSIDGATPGTHDRIRGRESSFDRATAAVRHLVEEGVPYVAVLMTVMRGNAHETGALIDLALRLGASGFHAIPLAPCGRGAAVPQLGLSRADRQDLRRTILHRQAALGGDLAVSASEGVVEGEDSRRVRETGEIPDFLGCKAGRTSCHIDANGDVLVCPTVREPVAGNARDQPFKDIWDRSPVFERLRRVRNDLEECAACRFKYVCARECPLSATQRTVDAACRKQNVESHRRACSR